MALKRMDNVGIVVDDLPATIEFFQEIGLELEGQARIEGDCTAGSRSRDFSHHLQSPITGTPR